jgi:hypothetical protein
MIHRQLSQAPTSNASRKRSVDSPSAYARGAPRRENRVVVAADRRRDSIQTLRLVGEQCRYRMVELGPMHRAPLDSRLSPRERERLAQQFVPGRPVEQRSIIVA